MIIPSPQRFLGSPLPRTTALAKQPKKRGTKQPSKQPAEQSTKKSAEPGTKPTMRDMVLIAVGEMGGPRIGGEIMLFVSKRWPDSWRTPGAQDVPNYNAVLAKLVLCVQDGTVERTDAPHTFQLTKPGRKKLGDMGIAVELK